MNLLSNIINNFNYLKSDFIGIKISLPIIYGFLTDIFLSLLVILIFYLIGNKIKQILFKDNKYSLINFFIEIALGYIFCSSGVLILGMLGLFYKPILYIYFLILLILALFPLNSLIRRIKIFKFIWKDYKQQFINNKLVNLAILSFVLIGFLKLLAPEVGVDAIWYHTDYPKLYLNSHTMMSVDPRGKYYPAVTPTLSDMIYVFPISISQIDSSRFIHFSFYILCVLVFLIVYQKRFKIAPFAALLFVTSPIIIRVSSSAYAEFQWILCWLLAVFIITKKNKHTHKDLLIPAILIGGTLATKLWMLPFYGVFILYIFFTNFSGNKLKLLKLLTFFSILAFSIPFTWYLRAFIITGNPLFPTFWNYPDGTSNSPLNFSFDIQGIKDRILSVKNISPLSVFGIFLTVAYFRQIKKLNFKKHSFIIFAIILTIVQIIINYSFHRFIIPFYSVFAIILAFGIYKFIKVNKFFSYLFYFAFSLLFLYYFLNTLFILPYGFGWANNNNYLTRVLSRDNSSFYDYNYQFSKRITKNDLVATYGLWGFYYGNFNYVYTEDIIRKGDRDLEYFKKRGANKLMILGGDINWFCKIEKLSNCTSDKYILLTYYKFPTINSAQYLYLLK